MLSKLSTGVIFSSSAGSSSTAGALVPKTAGKIEEKKKKSKVIVESDSAQCGVGASVNQSISAEVALLQCTGAEVRSVLFERFFIAFFFFFFFFFFFLK